MAVLNGMNSRPESYLFCVCLDGTIALFTSNRAEKRAGWTKLTTQGKFHSLQVIDNRVFVVGVYDVGGGSSKFVLSEFDVTKELDFSNTFSGTSGVFDVSAHFANGAVVSVVSNNNYLEAITSAEIGYEFSVVAETNPIDGLIQGGPLTGQQRRVHKVIVDMRNTLAISVNSQNLIIRNVTDDMSESRTPVTGKKEFRFLGYSNDPTVTISQSYPLALDINGLVAEVSF